MLIDGHIHFFSRRFYSFWADHARIAPEDAGTKLGVEVPPDDDPYVLGARWLKELDAHGVNRAVLLSSVPGDGVVVGKVVSAHPDRFAGMFMLNPMQIDAMTRLRRGLDEGGLRGACFYPALHHYHADDERLHPVFTALERAHGVAFVHFGMLRIPIMEKLNLSPKVDLKYAHPHRLHSVCNAFPTMNFIIPHFGAGFFHETLMLGAQAGNVCVDTSSSNRWIDLFPGLTLEIVLQKTLEIFGPERVIFRTDSSAFPRGWRKDNYERQRAALEKIGAPPADIARIFGGNMARLLKWA